MLCGTEDKITPPDLSDELAGLIPDARIEMIQSAGHLTNLEQPEEFNRVVGTFIRAVDSRPA